MKLFNHWILQRITAIILIPSILTLLYYFITVSNNMYFDVFNGTSILILWQEILVNPNILFQTGILCLFIVLSVHIIEGIENVILDYVQDKWLKQMIFLILKILLICLIKCVFVYIF